MLWLQSLWLLLPAGAANMVPVFAAKYFPRYDFPIDCYKTFRDKRIFGAHKTFRGLLSGIISAVVVFGIQKILFNAWPLFREISLIDYSNEPIVFGGVLGVGALGGDLIKSFLKRQFLIVSLRRGCVRIGLRL